MKKITIGQLVVLAIVLIAFYTIGFNKNFIISFFIGWLVNVSSFWLFFTCFFASYGSSAKTIWHTLVFSEFSKLILTVGLFVLALRWSSLDISGFFTGFILMQIIQIILQIKYLAFIDNKFSRTNEH